MLSPGRALGQPSKLPLGTYVYLERMRATALVLALAALVVTGTAVARTIEGTSGSNRLLGTPRADSIFGLGGSDRLIGGAGTDFLHGGPGRDFLHGGAGNDRFVAQYDGARDRVLCGGGVDTVNADLLDRISPDCELVGRRLSRDPYTSPEGQHESQVEPDSLTVGRTTVATFQVGRRFDGAADNIGFAVSNDDGRTWRSGLLPGLTRASQPAGPHTRASDPVVAFDAANGVWLISTLALEGQVTRLTISRSSDGFTWGTPVTAIEDVSPGGITFDKEWVACDNGPSSPHRGRCYLVYTDTLRGGRLAVVTSTDAGTTWSAPVGIPVTDAVGAFPVIRQSGELVVVFFWDPNRIAASRSVDAAQTFSAPTTIATAGGSACRIPRFRAFPLPSADVDPQGRIWVTFHECGGSPSFPDNSVFVSTSVDGTAWTPPLRVTSGRNAVLPAIGIHPTTGRVAVVYYAVRDGGGVDAELIESSVGAAGFGSPRRLSAQTMRREWMPSTVSGRMLADYISVHYAGARPLAVWVLASEPVGSSLRQAVYATRG
jgi:hemolysin type calcium-binding protein